MSKKQQKISLAIFLVALASMLGSLYFSNFGDPVENFQLSVFWIYGYGFEPCHLCWWARILMYPIVPISLVGYLKRDKNMTNYILPLAIPGIFLELYHYILQKSHIGNPFGCTDANPCEAMSVNYLGFITIPFLALVGFTSIVALCIYLKKMKS